MNCLPKISYFHTDAVKKLYNVPITDILTDYHKFNMDSLHFVCEYMERNHISIREFASKCGVSATTVKNLRNGTCAPPCEI